MPEVDMATKIWIRRSGFTLMEAIVSMVVLTIVAMGAGGGFVYARRAMETGNQKIIAAHLIEARIADCMAKGAKSLAVAVTTTTTPELRNGLIARTVAAPETGNDGWKRVTIKVGWDNLSAAVSTDTDISTRQYFREAVVFISQG
jgi:prepilin-type N-terminal cleavage/methylation domain-containing protein